MAGHTTFRQRAARGAAMLARGATRLVPGAKGETLPGRLALRIDPTLIAKLGRGLRSLLVTGTNGKTTTTAIARALAGERSVANHGSNLPWGIASSLLAARRPARLGIFEVDEAFVSEVAAALRPSVLVVLNLSRDQLDRALEVRRVAARIAEAAASVPIVVANASDPLVVALARSFAEVRFVRGEREWLGDAAACPRCGGPLAMGARWRCGGCGLAEPEEATEVAGDGTVRRDGAVLGRLDLGLPGSFNLLNGLAAAVGVEALTGRPLAEVLAGARPLRGVEGRYGAWLVPSRRGPVELRTLLAKNPAGWDRMLALVAWREEAVVLGLNAEIADGRDTSWIWDVDFERVAPVSVVVTGRRYLDLARRLEVAGVEVACASDQAGALEMATARSSRVTYLGNYTAFREMVALLPRAGALETAWRAR
jgi:UDP-N-acetylmuramyl tripeptide synthase